MSNQELHSAARRVNSSLGSAFGFGYHGIKIYDLEDGAGRSFYEKVMRESESYMQLDSSNDCAISVLRRWENGRIGFSIVVSGGEKDLYVPLLGGQITHCEHMLRHCPGVDQIHTYNKGFSLTYRAMLGAIGVDIAMKDEVGGKFALPKFQIDRIEASHDQTIVDRIIAFNLAENLILGGEVPYTQLFDAPNQEGGWRTYSEIVSPSVNLKPRELKCAEEKIMNTFESMGFEPHIVIDNRDSDFRSLHTYPPPEEKN